MNANLLHPGSCALLPVHPSSGKDQQLQCGLKQRFPPRNVLQRSSRGSRGSSPAVAVSPRYCESPEGSQIWICVGAKEHLWQHSSTDTVAVWGSRQQGRDLHPNDAVHRKAADNQSCVTTEAVTKLCEKGALTEAVQALGVLVQIKSRVGTSLFCTVLKICNSHKNLSLGRRVHELSTHAGYQSSTFVANHILRMYASHGRLEELKDVFSKVIKPDAFSWTAVISAHAKHGEPNQAIKLYQEMQSSGLKPDNHLFVAALQACASARDLESGRQVHADVLKSCVQPNLFVWNSLVDMYAKCGGLEDARRVFDSLDTRDVVTWNAMIAAYAEVGQGHAALALHHRMEMEGLILADSYTFACLLKACATLHDSKHGEQLHAQIVQRGLESDIVLSNCLVDMYVSCGKLEDAQAAFESLDQKDVVTWTTMIAGYAEHGLAQEAFSIYDRMEEEGLIQASNATYACLLKACGSVGALKRGRQCHAKILERGLQADTIVGNSLISMYAKCGKVEEAFLVFEHLPSRDVVTWTAMIAGYAECGHAREALALYAKMEEAGVVLTDSVTFACLLKACASVAALQLGMQLHVQILESGLDADLFVGTCLVDMYSKCSKVEVARRVFDNLATKDVVTWNAMLSGYAEHGQGEDAIALHAKMKEERVIVADAFTFSAVLRACATVGALERGKLLHSEILKRRLEADRVVGTSLVEMYINCGMLEDAHKVFDSLVPKDVVTWTTMIARYTEHGFGQKALALYDQMRDDCSIIPNSYTFSCILKACRSIGALQEGKKLHLEILERGFFVDTVLGTGLIDMYVQCGQLEDARSAFDSLSSKDVSTWNTMMSGYAKHGRGQEALALYDKMEREGLSTADSSTFACLFKACAAAAAPEQGKRLHAELLERRFEVDVVLGNCLVDMFARCGRLGDARRVFDILPSKDVVTWTTMINGYGQANEAYVAIECFEEMMRYGVRADETTFTCLLVACSHEGLVKEGQRFFRAMVDDHGITPTIEHCTCMVDLLGRAGRLDEAWEMLLSFSSNDVGLTALLHACKCHGDVELGRWCFNNLIKSDPQNAVGYVLMGKIYADAGRWSDVEMIESLRKSANASKKPAVAGIEVGRHVHTFIVGEERGDISSKVLNMRVRLKEEGGHVPQTELVLKRLSVNEKEDDLCGHAEKLALAYGLMNTADGTPLLVTKNLRMCHDCHSSTEILSKVERREIIVRDSHRLHRFVDGFCLCKGRP